MPFVNLGLVPEAGSSLLAPLRFGAAKAAEFLLLAEPFDAETALRLGLVNALVEPGALYAHALAKAQALAAKPREALLASRRLMRGDPARCSRTWTKRSGCSTSACVRPKPEPRSPRS